MNADKLLTLAKLWYGYGTWSAPYWFIGPEPGMAKGEGDNLSERCEAWVRLGSSELLDCHAHHSAFGHTKWHARSIVMKAPIDGQALRPPTQSTWRRLITLLQAYKGGRTDNEAVGAYQAAEWGTSNGETLVAELSAIAANSLAVERDREAFRDERCAHIRNRMLEHKPRFVVMYGFGAKQSYEKIAGTHFDAEGYAWAGETLCSLVAHPTAIPGKPPDWWVAKGRELRMMINDRCERN